MEKRRSNILFVLFREFMDGGSIELEGGDLRSVHTTRGRAQREGERLEHGRRKKPRTYRWKPLSECIGYDGLVGWRLADTRPADHGGPRMGGWLVVQTRLKD